MSTPTIPAQTTATPPNTGGSTDRATSTRDGRATGAHPRRTTVPRVIRSEWIKLATLRSTWATVLATVLVIVGFGVLAALVASGDVKTGPGGAPPGGGTAGTNPLTTVLAGANLAVLIIAVLGSMIGAREYSTGMIRTTFSAVPRRLPVLWGKLLSFAAAAVPAVTVGVLSAFFAGMAVLHANGATTLTWTDDGVARVLLGEVYNIVGLGVIGLALGILLRSTAAAIGTVIGAVLFIPTLASALLPSSWDAVLKYLPSNAATAFTTLHQTTGNWLSPGTGALVFTAWIVLAVAGAAWALLRRDA